MTKSIKPSLGAVALLLLPCVMLWWFSRSLLFYPVFNAELLLALALLCVRPRLGLAAVAVATLVAIATVVALLFHFQSPIDFLAQDVPAELNLVDLLWEYYPFALVWLAVVVGSAFVARFTRPRDGAWLAAAMLALSLADVADLTAWLPPSRDGAVNLVGSPMLSLLRYHVIAPPKPIEPVADVSALADRTHAWAERHPGRGIVFVIAESMGQPVDPEVALWLDAQIRPVPPLAHALERGITPFQGTTTSGELRHLCQLRGSYAKLRATDVETCLPHRLNALGLPTIGLHAFSHRMFSRESWWPLVGLQHREFLEELSVGHPRRCGLAFRGLCDDEMIDEIGRRLRQRAEFIYYLSLNTHLPVGPVPEADLPSHLCSRKKIGPGACALLGAQGHFLRTLRDMLATLERPPLVVVVGDHAPPFVNNDDRKVFDQRTVPYWILTPAP